MKKLIHFVYQHGKYKLAFLFLTIGFILQAVLILQFLPEFLSYSKGIKNPDQLFSYNLDYISTLYQNLGNGGRSFYFTMLEVDYLYTIFSGIGYSLLLSALVKKAKWFITLPLFLALSDILENTSQMILMNNFPAISSMAVAVSSAFSFIKLSLSLVCISLILFYLIKNLVFWIRKGYKKSYS